MKALGIQVPSVVSPSRTAVLDSTTRLFIGQDVFFFTGHRERARFVADPLRYCRRLTDPVTLRRFAPRRSSPSLKYRGRTYYFSADSTLAAFKAAPDSFAVRRGM
jgi:YHS domain-containing protein